MATARDLAAATQNFIDEVPMWYHRGQANRTDAVVVLNNLQYATSEEIIWCKNATDAQLRSRAQRLPDRYPPNSVYPINPFWYHASIRE